MCTDLVTVHPLPELGRASAQGMAQMCHCRSCCTAIKCHRDLAPRTSPIYQTKEAQNIPICLFSTLVIKRT